MRERPLSYQLAAVLAVILAVGTVLYLVASGERKPLTAKVALIARMGDGCGHAVEEGGRRAVAELSAAGEPTALVLGDEASLAKGTDALAARLRACLAEGVHAIVLAPSGEQDLAAAMEEAAAARVPLVLIGEDIASAQRASCVSIDDRDAGRQAGEYLARLIGGKGRVAMLRGQAGSEAPAARAAGFRDALARFRGISLASSDQLAGSDGARQAAKDILGAKDAPEAVFTPDEAGTLGMAWALTEAGLAGGKVRHVGFGDHRASVSALESGDILGLIIPDRADLGYRGVRLAVDALRRRDVPPTAIGRVLLATRENLHQPDVEAVLHSRRDGTSAK